MSNLDGPSKPWASNPNSAVLKMTSERMDAGSNYLDALRKLGLRPNMALWVINKDDEEFRLLLFSEVVELKGSLKLYELLNKAYYSAQTPADFDPWVVELADTRNGVYNQIKSSRHMQRNMRVIGKTTDGREVDLRDLTQTKDANVETDHMFFYVDWLYIDPTDRSLPNARQQWRRLTENVKEVAA